MVEAALSEAVQWMLDNRSLALPARVFRLKDVLDAMPEGLQRRPGTRKATVEALRDHFKAKQWPVPIRPDGRNGDQFVPWLHPDVAWANLETGDVREMYKADRAKAKEAASKRRRRRWIACWRRTSPFQPLPWTGTGTLYCRMPRFLSFTRVVQKRF